MPCFVTQFDPKEATMLKKWLENEGFTFSQPVYTLFQAKKKGLSCTLYTSGKLTVQGKDMDSFIQYKLEPEILHTFTYGYAPSTADITPRIGIDESGKGDFFGPLCIAGVFADASNIKKLVEIGVKDSKKLKDKSILTIASLIRKHFTYYVVRINPEKYNQLYDQFGNLNLLLGWGHATVIENLVEKVPCRKVIIDQFAAQHVVENALKKKKKQVELTQRHRGEEDLVVAAASILARAAFLEGLEKLGKEIAIPLPKGASNLTIQAGKKLVREHGPEILKRVSKLHFKTYQVVLSE